VIKSPAEAGFFIGGVMPDFSAAIALLSKPIEYVISTASGAVSKKLKQTKIESKVAAIHGKLWHLQRVKTIWNPDRSVALSSIFSPVDVACEIDEERVVRRVSGLSDLIFNKCLLVGTVGQGKSILLKYILGREIKSGERIPLLYELRYYRGGSLMSELSKKLSHLIGVDDCADVIEHFFDQSRISLLLDGLDEVDPGVLADLLREIEQISLRYPGLKIVVTSRPDSGGDSLTNFSTVRIEPLSEGRLPEFFNKITKDLAFSKKIVEAISKSDIGVKDIIKTPLSATLVAIIYKSSGKIPGKFTDFFEELFGVLVIRHDASKQGWQRDRQSGLTDRQLQQAFEAFCFQVRRRKSFSCTKDESVMFAADGLSRLALKVSPEKILSDIKKITCLVIEEGRRVEFLHASVANYFSSKFISGLSSDAASKFYGHLLGDGWKNWIAEIDFLREIDKFRISEYFLIPDCQRAIDFLGSKLGSDDFCEDILTSSRITCYKKPDGRLGYFWESDYGDRFYATRGFREIAYRIVFQTRVSGCLPWIDSKVVGGLSIGDSMTWLEIVRQRGDGVMDMIKDEVKSRVLLMESQVVAMSKSVSESKSLDLLLTI
jgi:uncharacterized protein